MLPVTNHTLEKIELLFKSTGYRVRYEKGNFKTGACVLQSSKVVVVNKFSNLENKIQALMALLQQLPVEVQQLDDKQLSLLHQIQQTQIQL